MLSWKSHKAYLEARADIIETNTFSGTRIAQADYHMEDAVYDINYESARIAKLCVSQHYDVTGKVLRGRSHGAYQPYIGSISPDVNNPGYRAVTFDALKEAYYEQAKALMDGVQTCWW